MPAKTSVWAMAIPRNGRNKERAWSLIRYLSTRESTIAETLNGNGPVRPSAYEDARVKALIPYAAAEKEALAQRAPRRAGLRQRREVDGHLHRGARPRDARQQGAAGRDEPR